MKNNFHYLTLATLLLLPGCKWFTCCDHDHGAPATSVKHTGNVIKVSSAEEFTDKVIKATKPVVVDFSATWCGACQQIKPSIKALAHEHSAYDFVEVDVDQAGSVASDYNIQGIPAILFFHNGKEVHDSVRLSGVQSKEALQDGIQAAFKHVNK